MRLDTLHLTLDSTISYDVNPALMYRTDKETKEGIQTFYNYVQSRATKTGKCPHGIGRITYSENAHACDIQLSAKILLERYADGIHLGNLERVTDTINSTGVIQVTPYSLSEALVRRADIAVNLDIGLSNLPKYLSAIKVLSYNTSYRFDTTHTTTVDIRSRSKRAGERLRIYGKRDELKKAKNRKFLRAAGNKVFKELENVLRFEREARTYPALRKCVSPEYVDTCDRDRVKLWGLLESPGQPVADMFDSVAKPGKTLQLFDDIGAMREAGLKAQAIIKRLGLLHIARQCGSKEQVYAIAEEIAGSRAQSYRIRSEIYDAWIEELARADEHGTRATKLELVRGLCESLRLAA